MATVKDIYKFIDEIAPFSSQEEWDNSGLQVGSLSQDIKKVCIGLDATFDLVFEAKENKCDLIISHHPFIFHPLKSFTEENPAYLAAKYNISVISSHTPFDRANGGVNYVLAGLIGLKNVRSSELSFYRLGETDCETVKDLAENVKHALNAHVCCSFPHKKIKTVAVCGGSASEYIEAARSEGADVFVTGEVKHHEILDSRELDIGIICAGHFETEIPAMYALADKLRLKFPEIEFTVSNQTSPIYHI